MNLNGKRVDLPLLQTELTAANVLVLGLGTYDDQLHTYDELGAIIDMPPEAQPVVDAHVAPPLVVEYAGAVAVDALVRTTDDVPKEVFRFVSVPKHVYKATFEMMAVDATSGATRNTEAKMTFKRTASALTQVGTTSIPYNAPDTATTSWAILPTVDGTDLVISVKGATGRTVDWLLKGSIGEYAPEGLAP